MKKLLMLVAIGTFMATSAAMAEDSVNVDTHSRFTPDTNGGYESTTSHEVTTPEGQTTASSNKKVEMNSSGLKETSVNHRSTSDPQGNSVKATTNVNDRSINVDGSEIAHKKTIDETSTTEQH